MKNNYINGNEINIKIQSILKKAFFLLKKEKKFKKILLKNDLPVVFIVPGVFMRKMEKKFFRKNKEPEILSFNWPKNFKQGKKIKNPLGEIYLNKKTIKDYDKVKKLLIHGLLHLLGFHHFKKNDIIKMEKKEKELLGQL